jgi:hypothetical protein
MISHLPSRDIMKKLVKANYKGKKKEKIIIDAATKGEITAYIKHSPTGAIIPVTPEAVFRMKNGETLSIEEAERTYDRFYFRIPFLAIRWGMETKECLGKLIELEVPCFFNRAKVPVYGNKAMVGQDDVCVFQEYVEALEKNIIKKKKDVQPEFIKYGCQ